MLDELGYIVIGIALGMLIMFFLLITLSEVYKPAITAIQECEKSLPRDQICKITAEVKK